MQGRAGQGRRGQGRAGQGDDGQTDTDVLLECQERDLPKLQVKAYHCGLKC